jgi:hypothetical protein
MSAHKIVKFARRAGLPGWAFLAALCGLIAAFPALPSAVRGVLLAAFVFIAPGAAILSWARSLPAYAVPVLVPVTGLATTLIVTAAAAMVGLWHPRSTLVVLAAVSLLSAGASLRAARQEALA